MADDFKTLFRAGKAQRGTDNRLIKHLHKRSSNDQKQSGNQQQSQQHSNLPADFFAPDLETKNATGTEDNTIDQDYAELMKAVEEKEQAPETAAVVVDEGIEQPNADTDSLHHNEEEEEAQEDDGERREFEQFVRQQRLEEIKKAATEKRKIELEPLILYNDGDYEYGGGGAAAPTIPPPLIAAGGQGNVDGTRDAKKKKIAHTIASMENVESGSDIDSDEEDELLDWRAKRVKDEKGRR